MTRSRKEKKKKSSDETPVATSNDSFFFFFENVREASRKRDTAGIRGVGWTIRCLSRRDKLEG